MDIKKREKMSAEAATLSAIEGQGLNQEQAHRVSTMVNRRSLENEKVSVGPLGFPSRWETSKPERLKASTTENASPMSEEPFDSLGDSIDEHLKLLQALNAEVDGSIEGGDLAPPRELDIREGAKKDVLDVKAPLTMDECVMLNTQGVTPIEDLVVTSSLRPQRTVEDIFYLQLGKNLPEPVKTSGDAQNPLDKISQIATAYTTAYSKLQVEQTRQTWDVLEKSVELFDEIEKVASAGYTLGEALWAVSKVVKSSFLPEIVKQSLGRLDVDADAVLGEARDELGNVKLSEVAEARSYLQIRDAVRRSDIVAESDLIKAAQAYDQAKQELEMTDVALQVLHSKLEDVDTVGSTHA